MERKRNLDPRNVDNYEGSKKRCSSLPHVITSSCASFLIRKGRFLAVVIRMSAACSVERKGRMRATILFPFRIHMICTKWSSLGLQGRRMLRQVSENKLKKSFPPHMLLNENTALIFTLQVSVLQNRENYFSKPQPNNEVIFQVSQIQNIISKTVCQKYVVKLLTFKYVNIIVNTAKSEKYISKKNKNKFIT